MLNIRIISRFKEWRHISLVPCRYTNTLRDDIIEHHRKSNLSITQEKESKKERIQAPHDFKYVYPEFLPTTIPYYRDRILEKLERNDMYKRRKVINIPEFYVGSIMAVTVSDPYATGKKSRFVGICIERGLEGMRAYFSLRNVIDGLGVEISYELYSPTVQKIEVLKLEKRLDEHLRYLRDAPAEYSTVPFDMEPVVLPPGVEVSVNPVKVKMNPYPWTTRWELHNFKGVDTSESNIWPKRLIRKEHPNNRKDWETYDLMKWYRESINEVETEEIMSEVRAGLQTHSNSSGGGAAAAKTVEKPS